MVLTGTVINVISVATGSIIGLLVGTRLPDKIVKSVFQAIGLFTLFLGVYMALKGEQLLIIIFSLIVGTIIGELLSLEEKLERLSGHVKQVFKLGNPKFTEGLITSFLLFCMGSMTILGAIDEGMGNGPEILLTKSLMDGISSVALASAFGLGVTFSVVPLFLFQGGITLLAFWLGDFFPETIIMELTAVGGILLIGLGINILEIKRIRVMNMLPALVLVIVFAWIGQRFFTW
ncbi:DUF554 domain-containing protein [Marinilabiliaceae bacterium JC017]|nr:DUF554 domain-containing protein [Marinilabiliaceae bacterium JC017]